MGGRAVPVPSAYRQQLTVGVRGTFVEWGPAGRSACWSPNLAPERLRWKYSLQVACTGRHGCSAARPRSAGVFPAAALGPVVGDQGIQHRRPDGPLERAGRRTTRLSSQRPQSGGGPGQSASSACVRWGQAGHGLLGIRLPVAPQGLHQVFPAQVFQAEQVHVDHHRPGRVL